MKRSFVICQGVYSSGSTWLYNVVHRIHCCIYNSQSVRQFFYVGFDRIIDEIDPGTVAASLKTHEIDRGLDCFIKICDLPTIVTIRNPLDAMTSMMLRFDHEFDYALELVIKSLDAALQARNYKSHLILKYEDEFMQDVGTIQRIADLLGIHVGEEAASTIVQELSVTNVKNLISAYLDTGVFDGSRPAHQWHPQTLWHPNHVGDGAIGKYKKHLSEEQIARIVAAAGDFMAAFDYPVEAAEFSPA